MRRELLMAEVARTPWAIERAYGERVIAVLERWSRGDAVSESDLLEVKAAREQRGGRQSTGTARGGIAVLPLYGVIAPKMNMLVEISGGTSCQMFAGLLRDAIADEAVGQILIDIDSPGGSVAGVQELANEILAARAQKPVIGVANHLAASAGYWLGACCTELYVSPSGEVGSIGVFVAHDDLSEAMQKQGVRRTYVSAGKYKTEGNSTQPLSESAREHLQSKVNELYRTFTAHVARGRGVSVERVRSGFGQGRTLLAEAAKAEGMVDGIMDFSSLVRDLQVHPRSTQSSRGPRAGAAAVTATSAAHAERRRAADARRREIDMLELGGTL